MTQRKLILTVFSLVLFLTLVALATIVKILHYVMIKDVFDLIELVGLVGGFIYISSLLVTVLKKNAK